ncbi:ArsR family transcriptional regulator [Methanococcus voltae]|jgi:ArsR family transcriptional regulator|uniref:ArsR family transcriptional regulator n=1 Tax=Methanococcus voltae PS TaxID=523842 RepID=A0ABT2EXU2_METVO|nr:metalloregulator ArsR/SmtB family transcription factor [Methanococcus voltae]MBP2144365.1 ArsR family transcriptional regulator [Methanococcus voltae]MCS3922632.1 ArsR family transcriptional regulator [Methanococcus voltae PS]
MMSEQGYEHMAETFKAFADPTRLMILRLLNENESMCVCKIIDELGKPQPTISHHLNILKKSGLIKARKEGTWNHYYIVNPKVKEMVHIIGDFEN